MVNGEENNTEQMSDLMCANTRTFMIGLRGVSFNPLPLFLYDYCLISVPTIGLKAASASSLLRINGRHVGDTQVIGLSQLSQLLFIEDNNFTPSQVVNAPVFFFETANNPD